MFRISRMLTLALIVMLLASMSTTIFAQVPAAARTNAPIHLRVGTFTPGAGERPNIPSRLTRTPDTNGKPNYYLVQFTGPILQEWKDSLSALGATVLDYVPDNAFKVRMTAAQATEVSGLSTVNWVGSFEPAYVLSPDLQASGQQIVRVKVERGGDHQALIAIAAKLGIAVAETADGSFVVAADRTLIDQLAVSGLDVAWIEPYVLFKKHNEYGGGQIIGGGIANTTGYDGSTQIAAVADTGLGGGTVTTAHRDIPSSRITAIYNWPGVTDSCFQTIYDDGAVDVDSGHGTHVAGSVLSGGTPGTGVGKGVAPAAHLVFQAIENYVAVSRLCSVIYGYTNDYYLPGLNDLNGLFLQAYNAGARIHSNSWGSSEAGAYTDNSVTADTFIWNHRDFTITFSAGNEGADANADGVVDTDSIGSPATAKNVITVGASENNRQGNYQCDTGLTYTSADTAYQNGQTCSSMGGTNVLGTPRERWSFTANPIADDPTAGNAEQMAAFSSRGPTDDGRIKPDIVAPGTWILSTYSDMYQQGYDTSTNPRTGNYQSDGWGIPLNAYYKYFGGTSMSNPIAAGAATVVRDFYQKAYNLSASAALVKATLINAAVDLLDENNDGVNDNDYPIPNNHEGWGRIDLVSATDGTALYVDNTSGLSTNGTASSSYTTSGGQPLKISLVWSDYPSTTTASINLVNNLNLTVSGPGGVSYKGNVFSGGWSQTGGSADALNNVENVYIQSAAAGTWTVTVTGANVPQGTQPFALVVRGAQAAPPPAIPGEPSNLTATAISSSQINLSWTASSGTVDSYKIERCQGAGCSSFAQIGTSTTTSYSDTGLSAATSYSYRVRASNAGGDSTYSTTASATTNAGATSTGFLSPAANAAVTTSSGDNNGYQSSPANAYANDSVFATDTNSGSGTSTSCTNSGKDRHIYYNYNLNVPSGATVNGVEVRLDAKADATTGAPKICVALSWDGGTTWTSTKSTSTLTTAEASYIVGGAADTWSRTWSSTNFSNANFRIRLTNVASNNSRDFSLDWVSVQVTYQ